MNYLKSIYVDVPSQLQSLSMLDKYLNRTPLDVQKVEIEAEKAVDNSPRKEVNRHLKRKRKSQKLKKNR